MVQAAELLYCLQPKAKRHDFPMLTANAGRSHIVVDESFDGSPEKRWTAEEIARFRQKNAVLLCYFSIGEAEDYRGYWKKSWKKQHPAFLLAENPEWKGNYRVRYWDKEWQSIMLMELDRIVAAGFDGVYLDIVDGYEFFEEYGKHDFAINPATNQTYRADMIQWIQRLAAQARAKKPNFQIFMQNGEALLADDKLLSAISGIAVENLFFDGNKIQKQSDIQARIKFLQKVQKAGKPCFDVEYLHKNQKQKLLPLARQYHIPILMTDIELTTFGTFIPVQLTK